LRCLELSELNSGPINRNSEEFDARIEIDVLDSESVLRADNIESKIKIKNEK
jgi:hypothetical protein